jgi:hypothetical protein
MESEMNFGSFKLMPSRSTLFLATKLEFVLCAEAGDVGASYFLC